MDEEIPLVLTGIISVLILVLVGRQACKHAGIYILLITVYPRFAYLYIYPVISLLKWLDKD